MQSNLTRNLTLLNGLNLIDNILSSGQILQLEEIHYQMQTKWKVSQANLKNSSLIKPEKVINF